MSLPAALLFAILIGSAQAAPILKTIRPFGAQRGTTFTLTLVGAELTPGSELITTLPATITRLAPPRDSKTPDTELPFLIELKSNAPVALYPMRLRSADGISNLLLFSVGDFPEVEIKKEREPKESRKTFPATKVSPPVIVNSTLKAGEQDAFRFSALAGQTLVFEVEARRMGSALDPTLRVLDRSGREIAFNDDAPGIGVDARVEVKFPQAGEYRVVVHDSRFSDQDQNFYRLKIGQYLFAEGIFPLGWQRGKEVAVTLFGGNLPKTLTVRPTLDLPASQRVAMVSLPPAAGKAGSLPVPFFVSDAPEILEPAGTGPVDLPSDTIVNGRISVPGEKDLYRLPVKPREKWFFEIQAASLGTTKMGAFLGIYDRSRKLLRSTVDQSLLNPPTVFSFAPPEKGVDPKIVFQVPEQVDELILSVEDLNHAGGPDYCYRLRATRQFESFALEFANPYINIPAGGRTAIAVRAIRDSYFGPIQLQVANAGESVLVEGGHIPAGITEGILVVSTRPGVQVSLPELEVWGEGISSTHEPIRRRVSGPGMVTPVRGARRQVGGGEIATQKPHEARWLGMELPVGVAKPAPVVLEVSERQIKLVQGLKQDIQVKVVRNLPVTAPIRIEGQRPGGIDIRIRGGAIETKNDSLPVQVSASYNSTVGRFDMVLLAQVDVGGRIEQVTSPGITVDLVRAYALVIPSDVVQAAPGATVVLSGKIHRQYPFQEAVRLKVEDLPLHATCDAVDVPSHESAFSLSFRLGAEAAAGEYEVRLVATARMEGRKDDKDYSIPDAKLRLKIIGNPTQSAGAVPIREIRAIRGQENSQELHE